MFNFLIATIAFNPDIVLFTSVYKSETAVSKRYPLGVVTCKAHSISMHLEIAKYSGSELFFTKYKVPINCIEFIANYLYCLYLIKDKLYIFFITPSWMI